MGRFCEHVFDDIGIELGCFWDHVLMRCQASLVKFESQIDKLKAIKDAGEVVDFKAVQQEFKSCVSEVAENKRKANVQWEEAWSMLSEDEQSALLAVQFPPDAAPQS